MSCEHPDFTADVAVARLGEGDGAIRNFIADITIRCAACGEPFRFVGLGAGLSFTRPMVNVGATTLHAPIAPGEAPVPTSIRFDLTGRQS